MNFTTIPIVVFQIKVMGIAPVPIGNTQSSSKYITICYTCTLTDISFISEVWVSWNSQPSNLCWFGGLGSVCMLLCVRTLPPLHQVSNLWCHLVAVQTLLLELLKPVSCEGVYHNLLHMHLGRYFLHKWSSVCMLLCVQTLPSLHQVSNLWCHLVAVQTLLLELLKPVSCEAGVIEACIDISRQLPLHTPW